MQWKQILSDHLELAKIRICVLALLMATLGYWLGGRSGDFNVGHYLISLLGIALVGISSGVLNQYLEIDVDGKMWRTLNRPLPAERMRPQYVLKFGFATGLLGEFILLVFVNPVTAVLGGTTLLFYLGIYTPSKRLSPNSTLIGAIPGALPPLMGWTASNGMLHWEGLLLFLILFLWQIPHFLAIAWLYQADYSRAGLPVLPVVDPGGLSTGRHVILYLVMLTLVACLPTVWGLTGRTYLMGMLAASGVFLVSGIALAHYRSMKTARGVFYVSIIYLPVWAALMVLDTLK